MSGRWNDGDFATPANLNHRANAPVYNVKDFGAVGDGSTDDSGAFQSALDSAKSHSIIYVPEGDYKLDSEVQLYTRQRFVGAGQGTTLIAGSAVSDRVIGLSDGSQFAVEVAHMRIDGNNSNTTQVSGIRFDNNDGVGFQGQLRHRIHDVEIFDTSSFGVRNTGTIGGNFLYSVHVEQAQAECYDIGTTDNLLLGCVAGTSGVEGFDIRDTNNRLVGCKAFGAGNASNATASRGKGFKIDADRVLLAGCEAQDNADAGFVFFQCKDVVGSGLFSDSNDNANFRWNQCQESEFEDLVSISRDGGTFTASFGYEHQSDSSNNFIRGRARGNSDDFGGSGVSSEVIVNERRRDAWNREALSSNKSLNADSQDKHTFDPDGSDRTVELPSEADGRQVTIANRADAAETIAVTSSNQTRLAELSQNDAATFESDGSGWATILGGAVDNQV